ncbi:hypothetical protein BGW37DRAFT_257619 [Umbelopsis sp. PMI_123]|nr:hypothetical protein BGW37DRAFT_257619 [Umbelopsis sp. PMI_123]
MAPHAQQEAKKRKHADQGDDVASKKSRMTVLNAKPRSEFSAFSEVSIRLYIHLAPMWVNKPIEGVNEQLNAFLMKYIPEVDGVVVAHSGLRMEAADGRIMYDCPFSHFFIRVKLLVWKPNKGEKLVGKINLQSPDHIGLLIYGTFNASIPREHISQTHFEWRASAEEERQPETEEAEGSSEETEKQYEYTKSEFGEWVTKATGQGVGQNDGILEFSVVNLVSANDILTVTGALLSPPMPKDTTSTDEITREAPSTNEKSKKEKKEKKEKKNKREKS